MMLLSMIVTCLLGAKLAFFMVKETEACRNAREEEDSTPDTQGTERTGIPAVQLFPG